MALTTTIAESITFSGGTDNYTDTDVAFSTSIDSTVDAEMYTKKIIKLSTDDGGVHLYTLAVSPSDDSVYDSDEVLYARITNIDLTNPISIQIKVTTGSSSDHYFRFIIEKGGSFIINKHDDFMSDATNGAGTALNYGSTLIVRAEAHTLTSQSIELFIAYEH